MSAESLGYAAPTEYVDDELDLTINGKRGHMDLPFLLLVFILLTIGIMMVLTASYASAYYESGNPMHYFIRQAIFAAIGIAAMIVVSRFTTSFMRNWSMWLLVIAIGLLIMVLLFGVERNYAKRWFELGPAAFKVSFQPSEVAKIAVIMSFSVMMCKNGKHLHKLTKKNSKKFFSAFAPFAGVLFTIAFLLYQEPHYSAIIIIFAIAAVVLFAGGFDKRLVLVAIVAAGLIAGYVIIKAEQSYSGGSASEANYAYRRIVYWMHPDADISDGGYQVRQSLIAVGSGGLTGLGIGQSRQKYLYLPEEHNDYIFAIVCEEFGFIGALLILALFALLIIRGFWIAMRARTKYDALVVAGITGKLAIQVFLNISVVTNLLPCTGISLPFFSFGGTALIMQLAEMGIVLSMSRDMPMTRAG